MWGWFIHLCNVWSAEMIAFHYLLIIILLMFVVIIKVDRRELVEKYISVKNILFGKKHAYGTFNRSFQDNGRSGLHGFGDEPDGSGVLSVIHGKARVQIEEQLWECVKACCLRNIKLASRKWFFI